MTFKELNNSVPRKIDLIHSKDLYTLPLLMDAPKAAIKNASRNLLVINERFHFQTIKKNTDKKRSIFTRTVFYDNSANPIFMFEALDWLSLLIAANLHIHIGIQSDGQNNVKTGNYSSKNNVTDFINYTKFLVKNIDSLKNSYGYLHIATSQTYANTTSLLVAYDWFKESAFNNFIKSLDTKNKQDKSRLLLVLVYWMNNASYELFNADVTKKLDGLLSAFMGSIVGEFNPILKPHENTDTTLAELIAQQIFYEYRYTSWKTPDNPFIYLSQVKDGTKLPVDNYDLNNIDFAHAVNDNVSEVTKKFTEYFDDDDPDGLVDFVFEDLSKYHMALKFGSTLKERHVDPKNLKSKFMASKQYNAISSIKDKKQRWKKLLIELDKFLNSTDININGLLATISNIKSLKQHSSIESKQQFWKRIDENLATPEEIKLERQKQVDQRKTSIKLIEDLIKYLNEQASYDETLSDEEWLKTQKEIYKRQKEITGLPSDSTIPSDLLNTILKP
ncbi:hypothetical protein EFO81_04400 [Lactiplantibacillus plantarum]|uniref:hypothetical protein n=1 Tax=Lactiplantibacillus plantarum TaxID=1590 RepID=UPI0021A9573E|nr:hypothetical protein [Lactiplantibacillus plantarum]MCT3221929.1 hypothetical protein [Lactiplantibacillus plantarum]